MGHKYVGLDVHQSSMVAAVHDAQGKSVMESILATEAEGIRDFLKGLRGTIHVTFEEGTQAAWLYEIVKPVVALTKCSRSCAAVCERWMTSG